MVIKGSSQQLMQSRRPAQVHCHPNTVIASSSQGRPASGWQSQWAYSLNCTERSLLTRPWIPFFSLEQGTETREETRGNSRRFGPQTPGPRVGPAIRLCSSTQQTFLSVLWQPGLGLAPGRRRPRLLPGTGAAQFIMKIMLTCPLSLRSCLNACDRNPDHTGLGPKFESAPTTERYLR